jgi:hypothetical protein
MGANLHRDYSRLVFVEYDPKQRTTDPSLGVSSEYQPSLEPETDYL